MGQKAHHRHLPSPQTKAPWLHSRAAPVGGGGQGEVRCGCLWRVIQFSFIVQLLEVIRQGKKEMDPGPDSTPWTCHDQLILDL